MEKNFFAVVVLQFDYSCYVDAKQYHLASFSAGNSTCYCAVRPHEIASACANSVQAYATLVEARF